MKKLIFTALLAVLGFSATAFAQDNNEDRISTFVRGGASISSYYESGSGGSNIRLGYNAGLGVMLPLRSKGLLTHIQSSLLLVSKGAKNEELGVKTTIEQVYAQIPIQFVHKFSEGDDTGASIGFGPYLAYGLWGDCTIEQRVSGTSSATTSVSIDTFGDELKIDRFDVGLTLTFKLDFEKFLMGMDIDLGLTDIGSDRTVGRQTMKYPKNVSGSLYIGYRF